MSQSIQITGMKELRRDLKKISKDLPKELNKVAKDAAELVAEQARVEVPVLTGRTQAKIKAAGTAKGGQVRVNGLVYAPVIHFGWRRRNIEPNPYLYNSLDKRRSEVLAKFEKELAEFIDKNVGN